MATFGLRNQRGSCWVNATIQSIFRIPEIQKRYSDGEVDRTNPIEVCLEEIWGSNGEEGLNAFYECVKTAVMPAGEGIGDSHELLEFICDKVPFIDKMFRFKTANVIKCSHCDYAESKPDSLVEFSIISKRAKTPISDAIVDAVSPITLTDWVCEKCKAKGCTKQLLMGSFPKILTFHLTALNQSVKYTSILTMNRVKYALLAVVCFDGGHWWTYGRNMPPGEPWVEFNDLRVTTHDPQHFPVSESMRLLMYYRLNE
jgi:ubiquitin C-terminal hydrolase